MNQQLYLLLKKLTHKNNINLHQEELKLQLLSHPSYPSLHSVTGALHHFGVPNVAVKIPATLETLGQTPTCFMASVDVDSGNELVLVEKRKSGIRVTFQNNQSEIFSVEKFLTSWTGVIVAIEKDDTVTEVSQNLLGPLATGFLYLLGFVLLGYVLYTISDLFARTHFILSAIGVVISVFIVEHELGLQSAKANSFCNLSENTSCDAILNSKGATLFGFLKLTDMSIVLFTCCCFSWALFAANGISNFTLMSIVILLAFPFTLYSLYYQYRIVKKWCPLCLGIAGVLLLQTASLAFANLSIESIAINLKEVLLLLTSFIAIVGSWSFLKPLLKKQQTLKTLEVEHYKFKRNFSLFNALHKENDLVDDVSIPGEIVFGNENAPLGLTLVTSPLCHFCKKAHEDIEKILVQTKNNVKITIRFNVDTETKEGELYKVVSQLLHIYHTEGKAACLLALKTLYANDANVPEWVGQQNIHFSPAYDKIMRQQKDWCQENAINFTPALYLNNRQFPLEYDRMNLLYFIDELTESIEIRTPLLQSQPVIAS